MTKKIITLSGDIGSGKSSTASCLADVTGYAIVGTGKIQRAIAEKRGLTTLELNRISQTDSSVDEEIDTFVVDLGKSTEKVIVDSRLAWHFIPDAFKVFLAVDPLIGAQRVFQASRADENNVSLEQTLENNLQRQQLEDERFAHLYNIRFRSYGNYDAVIDTSFTEPRLVAAKVHDLFDAWENEIALPHLWLNPKRLKPSKQINACLGGDFDQVREAIANDGYDYMAPINVVLQNGQVYLWDGHKRAIASKQLGLDLIPALVKADDAAQKIGRCLTVKKFLEKIEPDALSNWEAALS